jgi:hypothetical protein
LLELIISKSVGISIKSHVIASYPQKLKSPPISKLFNIDTVNEIHKSGITKINMFGLKCLKSIFPFVKNALRNTSSAIKLNVARAYTQNIVAVKNG